MLKMNDCHSMINVMNQMPFMYSRLHHSRYFSVAQLKVAHALYKWNVMFVGFTSNKPFLHIPDLNLFLIFDSDSCCLQTDQKHG